MSSKCALVNAGAGFNLDARTTWDTHFGQITQSSLTASFASGERSLALSLGMTSSSAALTSYLLSLTSHF